jgi:hypothetical protein
MTTEGWMPVVYGRTRRVDRWWRALPPAMDPEWARVTIHAATAGGAALEEGPRLLLAQNQRYRLVGGACLARDLSATMNTDGRRGLYCFVGWACERHRDWADVPPFCDLSTSFQTWATPVYEHWMGLDWELHESELMGPRASFVQPAPWPDPKPAMPRDVARYPQGAAVAWPESSADVPWDVLRLSNDPGLLVTGWHSVSSAPLGTGIWIATRDIAEVTVLHEHVESAGRSRPSPTSLPTQLERRDIRLSTDRVKTRDASTDALDACLPTHGLPCLPENVTEHDMLVRDAWSRVGEIPPTGDSAQDERDDRRGSRGRRVTHKRPAVVRRLTALLRPPDPRPSEDDPHDDDSEPPQALRD